MTISKPAAQIAVAKRLIGKREVCAIAGLSYPTIWSRMRAGTFPRSRVSGGKTVWLSTEIDAWLASLPVRKLKGDPSSPEAARPLTGQRRHHGR
jgi:predicted DNA-binding transcriptional regulator AlpA